MDDVDNFVAALCREMELRAPDYSRQVFDTVFWGGGTPSLLTEKQFARIRESLWQNFRIRSSAEFTVEANPGTLSLSKLRFLRELGVNRLSLGVQSFNPDELRFLGRIHSVHEARRSFQNARAAGFDNINIDLMTAFPGISAASFQNTLNEALKLLPEHISCYTLIFEPGTVFYKKMKQGILTPVSEAEEAGFYEMAAERLSGFGYRAYEISNFSRGGEFVCRHNLIYWNHRPYLSFGPSAHSFDGVKRWGNARSLAVYLKQINAGKLPVDFEETLSPEQLRFEYIFLQLRLREGINLREFQQRFGMPLQSAYAEPLHKLQQEKLIEIQNDSLRLSPRGWMLADSVSAYF